MTGPFAGPEWEGLRQQATRRCYQPKGLIVYNMRGERVWIAPKGIERISWFTRLLRWLGNSQR